MNDVQQAIANLAVIRMVTRATADAKADATAVLTAELGIGERRTATIGDEVIGSVTKTNPKTTAEVVDEAAFLAWVKSNRPDAIVETVRDSDRRAILAEADKTVRETGELPDGVDLVRGRPTIRLNPASEAEQEALTRALTDRGITLDLPLMLDR